MYQGFTEYLKGRYITAEEVLELLYDVAEESELLRNSVIVLDAVSYTHLDVYKRQER